MKSLNFSINNHLEFTQSISPELNNALNYAFDNDKFNDFCCMIENTPILANLFSVDWNANHEKNAKYIEFLLYAQKEKYNLENICYLVSNGYTQNVIYFFDNLKDLEVSNNIENSIDSDVMLVFMLNYINCFTDTA